MTKPLPDVLGDAIGDAINSAVATHEGGFVTKWVGVVESVAPDGSRGLWTMTSDEVMPWDVVGMLQHGLSLVQAQAYCEHDDDDVE